MNTCLPVQDFFFGYSPDFQHYVAPNVIDEVNFKYTAPVAIAEPGVFVLHVDESSGVLYPIWK